MVKKEGNIWAIDENGTVVKEYKSMQEVSDITGVNLSTLFYRFYHLKPTDGLMYILRTSYEEVLQNNLHSIFYSHRNLNKIRMEKSSKKKVNHTIKYEVRHKLVCIKAYMRTFASCNGCIGGILRLQKLWYGFIFRKFRYHAKF